MPIRQVFEAPFAIDECLIGGGEGFDHGHEMAVVVHEFELDDSQVARIAGDSQCGVSLIAIGIDQRLEAEPLQPLCDGAPVPA